MAGKGLLGVGVRGGSFEPDGSLPEYTSMTELDTALTEVGGAAKLVGATTAGLIALVRRISAGARGLVWMDELCLDQADGTELDGAFAPVSIGATPAATWGGAGSRGLIMPAGTIKLPGWAYVTGRRANMVARVLGWAVPASPAQHDCIAAGFIRQGGTLAYGGGIGYNSSPFLRGALISGGTAVLPTGTYSATSTSSLVNGTPLDVGIDSSRVNSADASRYSAGFFADGVTSGGVASPAIGFQADVTDLETAFMRRGNWSASARVTRVRVERAIS